MSDHGLSSDPSPKKLRRRFVGGLRGREPITEDDVSEGDRPEKRVGFVPEQRLRSKSPAPPPRATVVPQAMPLGTPARTIPSTTTRSASSSSSSPPPASSSRIPNTTRSGRRRILQQPTNSQKNQQQDERPQPQQQESPQHLSMQSHKPQQQSPACEPMKNASDRGDRYDADRSLKAYDSFEDDDDDDHHGKSDDGYMIVVKKTKKSKSPLRYLRKHIPNPLKGLQRWNQQIHHDNDKATDSLPGNSVGRSIGMSSHGGIRSLFPSRQRSQSVDRVPTAIRIDPASNSLDAYSNHSMPNRTYSNDSTVSNISRPTTDSMPMVGLTKNVSCDMLAHVDMGYSTTITSGAFVESTKQRPGQRARYSVYHGSGPRAIKRKFRVKPHHCFPEPVHMTEEDIYGDSLKVSDNFEFLKSYLAPSSKPLEGGLVPDHIKHLFGTPHDDGRIGALRVEILGCVALGRTKPDVAVYCVAGDVAFCTDVVPGYRSPMWPSASRRAAVFPLHHAYAKLYVGVFDAKVRTNKENDTFCGRVVIDVAAIRPDTEYDVTFPLRASSIVYDRRKRGVLRIRFSVHWFNERSAALSYFKQPHSICTTSPLVKGHPSIPCADPKTFRNVAVTVYGQDLPGKYSRNAFRSTVRELTLYQQNLQIIFKVMALDAILYEKPWVSVYLFVSGMYCVLSNSVRMVPAMIVGYLLLLYLECYLFYVEGTDYNLGYKPLTLIELAKAILVDPRQTIPSFMPILVTKRTKARKERNAQTAQRMRRLSESHDPTAHDDNNEIERVDHREFPFGEKDAYPKFGVEDALAPGVGRGRKASTTRLHGRLSVYYTATPPTASDDGSGGEDSSEDSERDDETIVSESGMGDAMYNLDMDMDDDEEAEAMASMEIEQSSEAFGNTAAKRKRVKVGPAQDNDTKAGKKIPPQLQIRRTEMLMHKWSLGVSVEIVTAPSSSQANDLTNTDTQPGGPLLATKAEELEEAMKKRRVQSDEFDRLLGLQSQSMNPLNKIMSSFLGPLMRMIRVPIFLFRIFFHITAWKDPFLSFWVLVGLVSLFLLLLVFPWRAFFFTIVLLAFGPQNIGLRMYLEKRAEKKDKEKELKQEQLDNGGLESKLESATQSYSEPMKHDSAVSNSAARRNFFHRQRPNKFQLANSSIHAEDATSEARPAFQADYNAQNAANKKLEPRAVAVPYSRLKKDRFFDWPPDPTVSRATPLAYCNVAPVNMTPGELESGDEGDELYGIDANVESMALDGDDNELIPNPVEDVYGYGEGSNER